MAIATTGSFTGTWASSSGTEYDASYSITVPSDANMMVVGFASNNYAREIDDSSISGYSLSGNALSVDTGSSRLIFISKNNPPAGSQTLNLSWNGTPLNRPLGWFYLKGVDTSSPIRTSGSGTAERYPETGNMTVVAGDYVICMVYSLGAATTIDVTVNGQSLIGDCAGQYQHFAVGRKVASSDSSTFVMKGSLSKNDFGAIIAWVIKPAPDAKGIPPTLILPNRFRTHLTF